MRKRFPKVVKLVSANYLYIFPFVKCPKFHLFLYIRRSIEMILCLNTDCCYIDVKSLFYMYEWQKFTFNILVSPLTGWVPNLWYLEILCLCVLSVSHKRLSWRICLIGQLKSVIVLEIEVKSLWRSCNWWCTIMEVLQNAKCIDWLSQYGALHALKAINICLCQRLLSQLQNLIEWRYEFSVRWFQHYWIFSIGIEVTFDLIKHNIYLSKLKNSFMFWLK